MLKFANSRHRHNDKGLLPQLRVAQEAPKADFVAQNNPLSMLRILTIDLENEPAGVLVLYGLKDQINIPMFEVSFQEIFISPQLLVVFDDGRIHAVDTEALLGEFESFRMADVEVEEGTGCAVFMGAAAYPVLLWDGHVGCGRFGDV